MQATRNIQRVLGGSTSCIFLIGNGAYKEPIIAGEADLHTIFFSEYGTELNAVRKSRLQLMLGFRLCRCLSSAKTCRLGGCLGGVGPRLGILGAVAFRS